MKYPEFIEKPENIKIRLQDSKKRLEMGLGFLKLTKVDMLQIILFCHMEDALNEEEEQIENNKQPFTCNKLKAFLQKKGFIKQSRERALIIDKTIFKQYISDRTREIFGGDRTLAMFGCEKSDNIFESQEWLDDSCLNILRRRIQNLVRQAEEAKGMEFTLKRKDGQSTDQKIDPDATDLMRMSSGKHRCESYRKTALCRYYRCVQLQQEAQRLLSVDSEQEKIESWIEKLGGWAFLIAFFAPFSLVCGVFSYYSEPLLKILVAIDQSFVSDTARNVAMAGITAVGKTEYSLRPSELMEGLMGLSAIAAGAVGVSMLCLYNLGRNQGRKIYQPAMLVGKIEELTDVESQLKTVMM